MRIGIVTLPIISNYGGILQNYALQQVLKSLGHDPITFDCRPSYKLKTYIKLLVKRTINSIISDKKLTIPSFTRKRPKETKRFIESKINQTKRFNKYYSNLLEEYSIEGIIVGSDQVWRPSMSSYVSIDDRFLKFSYNINIPKIGYGISFGVDNWEYNGLKTKYLKELIKKFASISVREQSGINLCKRYLLKDANIVLDPTLLLNKYHYENLCLDIPKSENILFAYILDKDSKKINIVNKIAKEKNLKPVIVSAHDNISLAMEEWLAMFRDAEYVITDSFHGTIFSMIFNKDFNSISNPSRGTDRFISLLKKFNLLERLVLDLENTKIISSSINWDIINEIIDREKRLSIDYLKSSIER